MGNVTKAREGAFKVAAGVPSSNGVVTDSGRLLHIAGQTSKDINGKNFGVGDISAQTEQVLRKIEDIVSAEGGSLADICRMLIFITDPAHLRPVMEVRRKFFSEPYPACTAVVVQLADPEWLIEIEATAALTASSGVIR